MNSIKITLKPLVIVLIFVTASPGCLSQKDKDNSQLLIKPSGVSEETWLKQWEEKITVSASLKTGDNYIYPNHYPTYVVRLSIKNKTGYLLTTGNNLYLVQTAKQSPANKQTTDLFEVIGGYFKQPPLEDYAGIVEMKGESITDQAGMGLVDWISTEGRGGFYSEISALLHIAGFRSKNPIATDFGKALPGDSLTIQSEELQLSIKIKPEKLADVYIVSPLLKFGANSEASFRYILRFEAGKQLAEAFFLPMSVTTLERIARDSSQLLWKRVFATHWAGQYPGTDAGPILTAALQDHSPALRKAALHAIGSAKHTPSFDNVLKIAENKEGHPSLRVAAINTLGQLKDSRSTQFLLSIAADKKSIFRESAFKSLANLGDPSAQEPILKWIETGGLPSENTSLPVFDTTALDRLLAAAANRKANKQAALFAIAKINNSRAIEILSGLYLQSDVKVRTQICRALDGIDNPRADSILVMALRETDQYLRSCALSSLASVKSPSRTKILVEQLSDPDPKTVIMVIRHVSETRIEEAKPKLLQLLNDHSLKPDVRRCAAGALIYFPGDESIKALIGVLKDPEKDIRIEAAQTLGLIPGKEQIPALTNALSDSEMLVRLYASRALSLLNGQESCKAIMEALIKEENGEAADGMANDLIQAGCNDPKQSGSLITRLNSANEGCRGAIGRYLSFASGKTFETGYNISPAILAEAIKVWTEWAK